MPWNHPCFDHLATVAVDTDTSEAETSSHDCVLERSRAWSDELFAHGRIVVYTDGACTHNQDNRLRRAGCGAFWCLDHSLNISRLLEGPVQSNQRAELQAVLLVLQSEGRALEIRTDCQYVYDGARLRRGRWRVTSLAAYR